MAQGKDRYRTDEERQVAARALDYAERAERGVVCFSDFLSPAERSVVLSLKELRGMCDVEFLGGYPDAERVRARFAPTDLYYEPDTPIAAVRLKIRGGEVSHRDILGSVLALGITRGKVGDILMGGDESLVLCDSEIASYICNNLERVGRCSVTAEIGEITDLPVPETQTITATVMSLRLDSVVAEGFRLSRTAAAELIKSGVCFVNWVQRDSASHPVHEGDRITVRGRGRIELARVGGQSKKGRTFIEILRYI